MECLRENSSGYAGGVHETRGGSRCLGIAKSARYQVVRRDVRHQRLRCSSVSGHAQPGLRYLCRPAPGAWLGELRHAESMLAPDQVGSHIERFAFAQDSLPESPYHRSAKPSSSPADKASLKRTARRQVSSLLLCVSGPMAFGAASEKPDRLGSWCRSGGVPRQAC